MVHVNFIGGRIKAGLNLALLSLTTLSYGRRNSDYVLLKAVWVAKVILTQAEKGLTVQRARFFNPIAYAPY